MSFSTYISKAILFVLIGLTLLILSCKDEEPTQPQNQKPQIQNLSANPATIKVNEETTLTCVAIDADGDNLTVSWTAPSGTFPNGNVGVSVKWKAPANIGVYSITATVSDGKDTDKEVVSVNVEAAGTAPSAPTLSSPSNSATNISIPTTLSWNASSGATSYTLQVSTNSNFTSFVYNQSGITGTSQQVTGLNNSTQYYWRVSATNSYGTSGWSSVWDFITVAGGTAPQPPTLSSPSNGATNIALPPSLIWNASTGATSYTLQVSTNSNFSGFVYNQSGLTSTSQQVTGLNNSTTYFWRVSAENSYGTSGWSTVWNFTTASGSGGGQPCPGIPTVTYAGKTYNTVLIGSQCWLKENLDVGTMINSTGSGFQQTNNGIIEKYCYANNPANCEIYGGLYEWPEAMQYTTVPGTQGICPPGWHIPTTAELQTLVAAVNNDGNALKAIGQGAGTDSSGFSALMAGYRGYDGYFDVLGDYTYFWSSTEYSSTLAYKLGLYYNGSYIFLHYFNKVYGFSVRCLKD